LALICNSGKNRFHLGVAFRENVEDEVLGQGRRSEPGRIGEAKFPGTTENLRRKQ